MTSETPRRQLNTADTAQTMADVRHEVDRIDAQLVELLAERQTFMDAAARIKPDRDMVRDDARIEDVVSKVLARAREVGLSPEIAEPVWRLLIERSIAHEYKSYDALKAVNRTSS